MSVLFFSSGMRRVEHQVRKIVWKSCNSIEVYRIIGRLSNHLYLVSKLQKIIHLKKMIINWILEEGIR